MDTNTNDPLSRGDDHAGPAHGSTDASDLRAGDDHAGPTGADPASITRGHELDTVSVKGILIVPVVIVVTAGLCFLVVTGMFKLFTSKSQDLPASNTLAARRAETPLNERLERISSTSPKAEEDQPRLEGMKRYKQDEAVVQDESDPRLSYRSFQPAGQGNSPEYHAEDLRANAKRDGNYLWPELQTTGWVNKNQGVAHIPIGRAMELVVKNNMLKTQDKPVGPNGVPAGKRPKASNSGRGPVGAGDTPEEGPKK